MLKRFKKNSPLLSLFGVTLLGVAFVLFAVFIKTGNISMWSCAFNRLTGLNCPSCGMTRSIESLLDFDLAESLAFNPSPVLFSVFYLALLIHRVKDAFRDKFTRFKYLPVWICIIVLTASIYAFLRNIGVFPLV